jgi:hypothetical protein
MKEREDLMRKNNVWEISDEWKAVWKIYEANPSTFDAKAVAADQKLSESEVSEIIAKLSDHYQRMADVEKFEAVMEEEMMVLEVSGVNTEFREVLITPTKADRSRFYPELFGDDHEDLERMKKYLMSRLAEETRGLPVEIESLLKLDPKHDASLARLSTDMSLSATEPGNHPYLSTYQYNSSNFESCHQCQLILHLQAK